MMKTAFATLALAMGVWSGAAEASSLRVAPTAVTLDPGANASVVRVWNNDATPVNVQVRVFRSVMVNGREQLLATRDVVASPPMTQLRPGTENMVRLVRVSGAPVGGSERYRLLVDELPDPARLKAGAVNVLVRHSIPVVVAGR